MGRRKIGVLEDAVAGGDAKRGATVLRIREVGREVKAGHSELGKALRYPIVGSQAHDAIGSGVALERSWGSRIPRFIGVGVGVGHLVKVDMTRNEVAEVKVLVLGLTLSKMVATHRSANG